MNPSDKECVDVKIDVGILKTQVATIMTLCDKMDKVIEKLAQNQEKIVEQNYNDMRKREEEQDADVKELHSRITTISRELSDKVELTERRIMDEIKSLRHDIAEHNKKEDSELKKILEWKWMAAGGIVVLVWLVSNVNFSSFGKLFN
jgi:CRISPR/Cas system CSM-associated protein Csm4 (group 5 of RAMP superfamily)